MVQYGKEKKTQLIYVLSLGGFLMSEEKKLS